MAYQKRTDKDILELIYKKLAYSVLDSIKIHEGMNAVWVDGGPDKQDKRIAQLCKIIKDYFNLESIQVINPIIINMIINDIFSITKQFFKQNIFYDFPEDFSLIFQKKLEEVAESISNEVLN